MNLPDRSAQFSQQSESMFGAIAPRYDLLNRVLSFGQDIYWRKKAIDSLAPLKECCYLDVATGTADLALEIAKRRHCKVYGVDFCTPMLNLGMQKVKRKHREKTISLVAGCGEALPFGDDLFDGTCIAFGLRNFSSPENGLKEMMRILRPKGRMVVLEFSMPENMLLKWIYKSYFDIILPVFGRFVSRHESAYKYLPESVSQFPQREGFTQMMELAGFKQVSFQNLTFGIVTLYTGVKSG